MKKNKDGGLRGEALAVAIVVILVVGLMVWVEHYGLFEKEEVQNFFRDWTLTEPTELTNPSLEGFSTTHNHSRPPPYELTPDEYNEWQQEMFPKERISRVVHERDVNLLGNLQLPSKSAEI